MGEWRATTFGALGKLFDGPHATPTRLSSGPYFLNISSLRSGRLDLSESDHVSDEDFKKWSRRVTPTVGDLLFSYETRLGEAALMPSGIDACLGRRMALLRPNREVCDPRFLLYLYLAPVFQRMIAERSIHGATVSRIPLVSMPEWEVSVPDLVEQQAIAAILGALDDKIAANERLAAAALALGDRLFEQSLAATGGLPTTTIGELATRSAIKFSDGYRTKKSEHGQPGLRILRAGDVRGSSVYPAGDDYVSLEYVPQIGIKASKPGDIVLTTKGTVGRVAVVAASVEQVVYSPQVCFFRVTDEEQLDRGYLSSWFRSDHLQRQSATLMYKSDMAPYISLRDIRSLSVPLPSIDEQRRLGRAQLALLAAFEASRVESQALARTRDELLPLLMSGKVTVRAAEELVGGVA